MAMTDKVFRIKLSFAVAFISLPLVVSSVLADCVPPSTCGPACGLQANCNGGAGCTNWCIDYHSGPGGDGCCTYTNSSCSDDPNFACNFCNCGGGGDPDPSCSVNLTPDSSFVSTGYSRGFTANITATSNGNVERVDFSISNSSVASLSPSSDSGAPYQTSVTGISTGNNMPVTSITVRANVIMEGSSRCSDTSTLVIRPAGVIQGRRVVTSLDNPSTGPIEYFTRNTATGIAQTITMSFPTNPRPVVYGVGADADLFSASGIDLNGETIAVTSTRPFGYETAYTLCYDTVNCHDTHTPFVGYQVNVSEASILSNYNNAEDPWPYADLYFHYTPLPTCTINGDNEVTIGATGFYNATTSVPQNSGVWVDANVEISHSRTRTWAGQTTLQYSDCGTQSSSCAVNNVAFNPTALGYAAGETAYISCRGWNGTLHSCNPYHTLDPQAHNVDVDCGGSDYIQVNVTDADPWWQVIGGNIISKGIVESDIPFESCTGTCNPYLSVDVNVNPFWSKHKTSGNVQFQTSIVPSPPNISYPNASTNTNYVGTTYGYQYFERSVPTGVTPATINNATALAGACPASARWPVGASSNYYCFYRAGGAFNWSAGPLLSIGDNRVILFVPGDLPINSPISTSDSAGFFMAIVQGNIQVNPSVGGAPQANPNPDIAGIYVTDGEFRTGASTTLQLVVNGTVVAHGGLSLQRDLENDAFFPAEVFEYGADYYLKFPPFFGESGIDWREVAP